MAREEAARLHHEYVGTEHILLGLIREGEGVAAAVLTNLNVDLEDIQQKIEETVKKGKAAAAAGPDLPYTSRAKKVLELAMTEARELNHSYVGTEHLLLGLLREEKGIAAQVLTDAGVNLEQSRAETLRLLGSDMPQASAGSAGNQPSAAPKSEKKSKTPALDHFCRDLTQLAAEGQLDPTIGRAKEIERVMEILARRKKNNPVLIGEPGVGKTAIVEGPGAPHRQRALPRRAARSPGALARHGGRHRGHQVSRPVRRAPQGGHERDRPEQADHPLHRRAAHPGRRGRGRRRDRRLQHAQARARAGRAPVRGRLDAERVPEVHREGRRPRAPLPDGRGRAALGAGDGRDPQGPAQEVRGPSPDQHPRRDARGGRGALRALHHRPVPAGQGDRRDRRGRRARPPRVAGPAGRSGRAEGRAGEGQPAEGRCRPRPELRAGRVPPRSGAGSPESDPAQAGGVGEGPADSPPGDRRGGHRLHRLPLDRHPGHPAAGGRDRAAAADGGRDPRLSGRPGRGHCGGVARHPALPRRPQGPQPPDRVVRLLRPHRGRQDRAGAGAGQVPLRRRAGAHPGGHVRVHGEVLGQPADRRTLRAMSGTRIPAR